MSRRFTFICDRHDSIKSWASDIEELAEDVETTKIRRRLISLARRIQKEVTKAKESGQSMENRLMEYRQVIEGLGFKRKI